MISKKMIPITLISMTFLACSPDEGVDEEGEGLQLEEIIGQEEQDEIAGLIVNNCYVCHSPDANEENRLAPPLSKVKSHYLSEYVDKESFVLAMSNFINAPNSENVLMYGAVDKFGEMPNMQYPRDDVNKIVNYLFDYEIETDEWLAKYYYAEVDDPIFEAGDYLGLGRHIATTTKQVLGKNLKGAIKNNGTEEAVGFCNLNAMSIIDSMSLEFDARIFRVSDKNRNPKNGANALEVGYIKKYQEQLDGGEEMVPVLVETADLATFYMPIVTNEMCLQCHGIDKDMDSNVLSKIQKLYPNDMARGYGINQIRGIWKIEMSK